MERLFRSVSILACLCLTAFLSSCATYYETEREWADMLVPPQAEAALGAYLASKLDGTVFYPINDQESDAYLTALGERMRATSGPCAQRFTYRFVADSEANAFAAPGGYVYVTSGLMKSLKSESELAAVVGHEVNHVVNRHGVRSMLRAQWISGFAQLAAGAAGKDSDADVQGLTQSVISLHCGRDMEREADDTGIDAAYRAGFHPAGAVGVFKKFRALEGGRRQMAGDGGLLQSHPDPVEREASARAKIAQLQLHEGLTKDSAQFQKIRERVIALAAKMPARAKPEGMALSSAFCGALPDAALPPGGLAAFGIKDLAHNPPPDHRPQQQPPAQSWSFDNGDDDEMDDEDEDEDEDEDGDDEDDDEDEMDDDDDDDDDDEMDDEDEDDDDDEDEDDDDEDEDDEDL